MLVNWVIPFFLEGDNPLKDPAQWSGKSIKFLTWMKKNDAPKTTLLRATFSLRSFYKFLVEEGRIKTGVDIRLRLPVNTTQKTPLKYTLMPDDILEFIKVSKDNDMKLLALLGYFFSIRPQEMFALKVGDFRAGSKVLSLASSLAMSRVGLFNKFVVKIDKQRNNLNEIKPPKSGSDGWVSCFSKKASSEIIGIIKERKPDEYIFSLKSRLIYSRWKKHGIKEISLKDLRRASIYYLGHHTDIAPLDLMKHARHNDFETTQLYLRRPEETLDEFENLDLEA